MCPEQDERAGGAMARDQETEGNDQIDSVDNEGPVEERERPPQEEAVADAGQTKAADGGEGETPAMAEEGGQEADLDAPDPDPETDPEDDRTGSDGVQEDGKAESDPEEEDEVVEEEVDEEPFDPDLEEEVELSRIRYACACGFNGRFEYLPGLDDHMCPGCGNTLALGMASPLDREDVDDDPEPPADDEAVFSDQDYICECGFTGKLELVPAISDHICPDCGWALSGGKAKPVGD